MHSTKQVSYRNDKTVLVKVYVEKAKKKRSSSIKEYHHHHHHYHIHHSVTQVNDGSSSSNSSTGYDRKSGLLMYSRLLRNSVRGGASSSIPLLPNHSLNNTNVQPTIQLNSIKKHGGTTSCFGNWKFLVPSFLLRSWSNDTKMEKKKQGISGNGFEKLPASKGKGFIVKVFSTCK